MNQGYTFEYEDEIDFRKKERSVRKYNMLAYKHLMFKYYPEIKNGNFVGEKIGTEASGGIKYELELPTDELFKKIHGPIILHYTVYIDRRVVFLTNLTPEEILKEEHKSELLTYKGVIVSRSNPEKDMFKINLLKSLEK